jgi:hypothetical protein
MKKLSLKLKIKKEIALVVMNKQLLSQAANKIIKFIQNNYRRRKYNVHHHSQTRRRRPAK